MGLNLLVGGERERQRERERILAYLLHPRIFLAQGFLWQLRSVVILYFAGLEPRPSSGSHKHRFIELQHGFGLRKKSSLPFLGFSLCCIVHTTYTHLAITCRTVSRDCMQLRPPPAFTAVISTCMPRGQLYSSSSAARSACTGRCRVLTLAGIEPRKGILKNWANTSQLIFLLIILYRVPWLFINMVSQFREIFNFGEDIQTLRSNFRL